MSEAAGLTLKQAHETFAKSFNNRCWALLSKAKRTLDEDEELILAADASLYHWLQVGTVIHAQRGHWLLAHAYTVLKRPADALAHALRCMALTDSNPDVMEDFDRAYAFEALARAYALQGSAGKAKTHHQQALAAGEAITDPESREIFMGDFESGDWFGII